MKDLSDGGRRGKGIHSTEADKPLIWANFPPMNG